MRLWHFEIIPKLSTQRLLGQHRECCALRGNGWNRKHSTVDYVFRYPPVRLYYYHMLVIRELVARGVVVAPLWFDGDYRGQALVFKPYPGADTWFSVADSVFKNNPYPLEHDSGYYRECYGLLVERKDCLLSGSRILPASPFSTHGGDNA